MGGYKIINFHNTAITTGTPVTISGVYEALENNYRKAIMLSGIVIDNVEYADAYITPVVSDTSFTFSVYGKTFTVTNEDSITVE